MAAVVVTVGEVVDVIVSPAVGVSVGISVWVVVEEGNVVGVDVGDEVDVRVTTVWVNVGVGISVERT